MRQLCLERGGWCERKYAWHMVKCISVAKCTPLAHTGIALLHGSFPPVRKDPFKERVHDSGRHPCGRCGRETSASPPNVSPNIRTEGKGVYADFFLLTILPFRFPFPSYPARVKYQGKCFPAGGDSWSATIGFAVWLR